jgi:concanavalin A-like lectin/glucanase superfamily protein
MKPTRLYALAAIAVLMGAGGGNKPETVLLLTLDQGKGKVVNDSSGHAHHGRIRGHAKWVDGKFGKALALDGKGHVDLGRPAKLDFGKKTDFTVECWVKVAKDTKPAFYFIVTNRLRIGDMPGFTLYLHKNFRVLAAVGDKVNNVELLVSKKPVNDGQWHHLALTCDRRAKASLYVDGKLQAAADMTHIVTLSNELRPLLVGSRGYSGDFVGMIDHLRISRGVRTHFALKPATKEKQKP